MSPPGRRLYRSNHSVLRVVAYPNKPTLRSGVGASGASSAEHIVLRDEHKRTVIQPLSKEPFIDIVSSPLQELAYHFAYYAFPSRRTPNPIARRPVRGRRRLAVFRPRCSRL